MATMFVLANDGETALEIMKDWPRFGDYGSFHAQHGWTRADAASAHFEQRADPHSLSKGERAHQKVLALDAGADDYVTKPFGMDELLARVRASLRRSQPADSESPVIEEGDFVIDPGAHKVSVRGREIHLTPKEFELLVFLARHAGKVVTHRALLGAIWARSKHRTGRISPSLRETTSQEA